MIVAGRKYRYRFATGGELILFKHILLSSILENNRVIVIEKQLKLWAFENLQLHLQLQQNRVINYDFVNYNYNFSKPVVNKHPCSHYSGLKLHARFK